MPGWLEAGWAHQERLGRATRMVGPELGSQGDVRMATATGFNSDAGALSRNIRACRDRGRVVPSLQTFLWGALNPQHPSSSSPPWEAPSHDPLAAWNTTFLFCRKKSGLLFSSQSGMGTNSFEISFSVSFPPLFLYFSHDFMT